MELVEGESLRSRIAAGPLSSRAAVRIARGIARGLARAHGRGVVHRDLKPENVMLDADGEPKILDFGLAKIDPGPGASAREVAATVSHLTEHGLLLGTPLYMSPEQALGVAVDARSDVFSFGVVLYEMLCGARPFGGDTAGQVLTAIARDDPPPLRSTPAKPPGKAVLLLTDEH
jgi:serine/threonine protein kinase